MKKHFYLLLPLSLLALFILIVGVYFIKSQKVVENEYEGITSTNGNDEREDEALSKAMQDEYMEKMNAPYGKTVPPSVQNKLWDEIDKLPGDKDNPNSYNSWINFGPNGFIQPAQPWCRLSGRVLDIEHIGSVGLRVATASGGLWEYTILTTPVPLTENLKSQIIGSFATKPTDANTIFVATGEYTQNGGNGLWKTTNRGANWNIVTVTPDFQYGFKVRYDPVNINKIHLCNENGYYRSDDGGNTFVKKYSGMATDVEIDPSNNSNVYLGILNNGVLKSTDGGNNFSNSYFNSHINRIEISIAASNPSILYAICDSTVSSKTFGIVKSTNGGSSWNMQYRADIHWGQGFFNNTIGVSPTDPNKVFAGGCDLLYTTNGGTNWQTCINTSGGAYTDFYNLHNDIHRVLWYTDGNRVYIGHDGGITYSSNAGVNWTTNSINWLPTAQFYHIDVSGDAKTWGGGTQDNSQLISSDGGSHWYYTHGGDGGGFAIMTGNNNVMVGINSNMWYPYYTSNSGANWTVSNSGYTEGGSVGSEVIHSKSSSNSFFVSRSNRNVYYSNTGTSWNKLNSSQFQYDINSITPLKSLTNYYCFVCLNTGTAGNRIWLHLGTGSANATERSNGIVANGIVRKIALSTNRYGSVAYALMNGYNTTQKIYKTDDMGVNWRNITGNLSNVPVTSLITHPTDSSKLYIGTYGFGCFKTTDGGQHWASWNNGTSRANLVTDLTWIDSTSTNGKFYAVMGTYGRGVMIREISGDDQVSIHNISSDVPDKYSLSQNYPNPFNPSTTIKFAITRAALVKISVFDISGREVDVLVNERLQPGTYSTQWNALVYSSGVYFYKIQSGDFVETKRMLLIK